MKLRFTLWRVAIIVAFLFLTSLLLLCGIACADSSGDCGANGNNLVWSLKDGVLAISGSGEMAAYNHNDNLAPWHGENISRIEFGSEVTSIGSFAFCHCSNLANITIPENITSIGSGAFWKTTARIFVTSFDGNAAMALSRAQYPFRMGNLPYTFRCTVKEFGEAENGLVLVRADSDIVSANIPSGVTAISQYSFEGCTKLTSVTVPPTVLEIGAYAFQSCESLETIVIPDSVQTIDPYAFALCENLKNVTLSKNLTKIASYTFSCCKSLKNITIPEKVNCFEEQAFGNCTNLESINFPSAAGLEIGNSAFYNCENLKSIDLPDALVGIKAYAFYGCKSLTDLRLPDPLTHLGTYAFGDCTGLKTARLSIGVTALPEGLFSGCTSLQSLYIIPEITSLGEKLCYGCSGLTALHISSGVKNIGNYAFSGCTSLVDVTIPEGLEQIGTGAFSGCCIGGRVYLPRYLHSIGADAFDSSPTIYCWYNGTAGDFARTNRNPIEYIDENTSPDSIRRVTLPESVEQLISESGIEIHANVFPNYDNPTVVWSSSDSNIISVSALAITPHGLLYAKQAGEVTITATVGNASASVTVSSRNPAADFVLPAEMYVFAVEDVQIPVSNIIPEGTNLTLSWTVDPPNAAWISQTGMFYCGYEHPGVVVTATTEDGISHSCTVHVLPRRSELDILYIPSDVTTIESQAFTGSACQAVIIPDNCLSVGAKAFADCPNLIYVRVPSTTLIADDAFENCKNLILDRVGNS